jgi:uncharacterized membrane protein YcaP (DUF421 family)
MSSWFEISVSPLELFVRGTTMYWFIFLVFRFLARRDVGAVGLADILLLVLVADAAQNAMSGSYESITDGIVLVSTILFWNLLVDWLSYRFPRVRRVLEPPPLALVVNGQIRPRNLRREFISRDELFAILREKGIEDLRQVKLACIESDGEISVIRRDGGEVQERTRERPGAA